MKTIFLDARHLHSGIGTYVLGIADYFHCANLPFKFVLIGPEQALAERYPEFDIIPCEIPIYTIGEQLQIPRIVKSADLFHIPHFNIPLAYRGALITTIHDTAHYALPQLANSLPKKLYRDLVFGSAVRKSAQIITVSQFAKTEILKYTKCAPEKVTVIHNGVLDIFTKGSWENDSLETLGIPGVGDHPYLLYVGNFKHHKNLERMVTAFRNAKRQYDLPHKLVMVGDVDKKDDIFLPEDFDIHFLADCDNEKLAGIYKGADGFLQVSCYEGFGLTPLEAMACGVPVLASDIPPLREVLADAAIFADPYSVNDLTVQLIRLCQDQSLREDLVRRGLERVTHFSWGESGMKTAEVYESVLAGRTVSSRERAFSS